MDARAAASIQYQNRRLPSRAAETPRKTVHLMIRNQRGCARLDDATRHSRAIVWRICSLPSALPGR